MKQLIFKDIKSHRKTVDTVSNSTAYNAKNNKKAKLYVVKKQRNILINYLN